MTSSPAFAVDSAGRAGRGVFATRDIAEGEIIWEEERPFLAVLDSSRLKEVCAWCFSYAGETGLETGGLKVCTGCKILRFCGVRCQTAAWKHSHKLECKIYKKLFPAVLPNTARMLMQVLLRRKASAMAQDDLDQFLELSHHLEDFMKTADSDNDVFENLQLMARAAQEYSGTGDNISQVQTVAARILINTLTLPTPIYTPIGLALSLKSALLNHSCMPNTVHVFNGAAVTLKATETISKGTELSTSYIDSTFPPAVRRRELQDRYFFHCECRACTAVKTLGRPDPPPALTKLDAPVLKELLAEEDAAAELVMGAAGQKTSVALPQLARALHKFSLPPFTKVHYPAWRQPLSKTRAELILALLALKRWVPALLQSLTQHLHIEAVVNRSATHPVRVARLWVLARLVNEVGSRAHEDGSDDANASDKSTGESSKTAEGGAGGDMQPDLFSESAAARALADRFSIEWGVLVWVLLSEAATAVEKSHGPNSSLTAVIRAEFGRVRSEMRQMGGDEPSRDTLKPAWERLRDIADHGWEWWQAWERARVEKQGRLVSEDAEMKGVLEGMELLYSDDPA